MPKAPAQVIGDGRVTIPANIRRKIGIEKGDYVIIDIQPVEWTDKGGHSLSTPILGCAIIFPSCGFED